MSELIAYIDGGSHGNPGPSGIGIVIEHAGGQKTRIAKWIGHQDNNVAEYVALLEALRQMSGEYACLSPRLYSLNWTCRKLARSLDFSITHVSRAHNAEANSLANDAVRTQAEPEAW